MEHDGPTISDAAFGMFRALWFLFFEGPMSSHRPVFPDELWHSISAPGAEGRWPGEDPALNKGPTPLPTALPGLLPQGGSSSLGFPVAQ